MKTLQLSLFCLIFIFFTSCKKDKERLPPPDADGYIWLRNVQSLPLIKQSMQGNWKIHYAYGGITGKQKIELQNSSFRYLSNDSLYIIFENNQHTATKANFIYKRTEFGFNAWVIDFQGEELYPSFIYNDTLSLGQNSVEPFSYAMTKIK